MESGQSQDVTSPIDDPTVLDGGQNDIVFSSDIVHHRIDREAWKDFYVIGDVHGCLEELRVLLNRLAPDDNDLIIFVGDLARKGPRSSEVIELVRSTPNMTSVRGNNEDKLLRGECEESLSTDHLTYLNSLPICLSWDSSLVVHGGLDPQSSLRNQTVETLLTMRSIPRENGYAGPFWFETYEGPPRVFFGHTVLDEPLLSGSAVGLDTGCVYGGALTGYDCSRDELVSVPANREYQPRADAKIVEPEWDE